MHYTNTVAADHNNCKLIQNAINRCAKQARKIYGDAAVDKVGIVEVEYYEKGRSAAIAAVGLIAGKTVCIIQFSMQLTITSVANMVSDTVPHEYAHVLCMANGWDEGHGQVWKDACEALGGTGNTRHSYRTTDGRMKNLYEAMDDCGASFWLTAKQIKLAASAAGFSARDATGRDFRLTKQSITGKVMKL